MKQTAFASEIFKSLKARRPYLAPQAEVVSCKEFCETIPVHFSGPGTGQVDARETDLDDEFDDWGQLTFDIWEE